MKNYFKQFTKGILVLLLLTCFTNCQKEELQIPTEDSTVKTGTRFVDAKNTPILKEFLSSKMNKYSQKSQNGGSLIETPFGYIPLGDIIEVVDINGNYNYTFKIIPKNQKPDTFYNLIVSKPLGQKTTTSFVLEYNMEENFAKDYFFEDKNFEGFQGVINKYSFEEFLDTDTERSDPPCPCSDLGSQDSGGFPVGGGGSGGSGNNDPDDNDNNNNGNGNGGNNGDTDSNGGGSGGGGVNCLITSSIEYLCTESGSHESYCERITNIMVYCYQDIKSFNRNSDCPISEEGSCLNTSGQFAVDSIDLVTYLGLTAPESFFYTFSLNQDIANAAGKFLWKFKDEPEKLILAKEIVIAISNQLWNGDGDKQERISFLESDNAVRAVEFILKTNEALENDLISSEEATSILTLGYENNWTQEAANFVNEAIEILKNGNNQQKRFVQAVLDDNIPQALTIALEGATYEQCCNPNDDIAVKMAWFTGSIVYDFHDAMFNLVKMTEDLFYSDEEEGKFVKIIMENSGVIVPDEISDELVGKLFKIRYEGLEMRAVPEGEWYQSYLDAAVTFLDIVAVLAPSSNGGAFLAIKGGGTITAQVLSDYLKVIAKGEWKIVNESMSDAAKSYQEFITGKSWNESFVLENVKFDGLKEIVLVDAKSGMLNFIDETTDTFKPFFTGEEAILRQAKNQREAAGDLPIEWHFEHESVRRVFEKLLEDFNYDIILKHTPR
ncbi:Tox-REase-5 domain-containing protein [Aquimarina sp. Aq107]|uniref:Tox-REase-5 domain-containing protein n=1 Tax=Aquimarina sp. Aq107 TaxID=1191912 RepID=UPI000D54B7DC|nr:Tox-REase-5 domain-containing protein [Aquimarina sp. Aq107]